MERTTYSQGDRIFIEGDPTECAYLIEEGKVELSKRKAGDVVVIGCAEKGEMLGEMALIDPASGGAPTLHSATARCIEKTTVMVVPKEEFDRRLSTTDPVIRRLLLQLIRRLRKQTRATIEKTTVIR